MHAESQRGNRNRRRRPHQLSALPHHEPTPDIFFQNGIDADPVERGGDVMLRSVEPDVRGQRLDPGGVDQAGRKQQIHGNNESADGQTGQQPRPKPARRGLPAQDAPFFNTEKPDCGQQQDPALGKKKDALSECRPGKKDHAEQHSD